MLRTAKLIALGLARRGGLMSLAGHSSWRRNRLLILAYHGVSLDDEHEWDPQLYMPPGLVRKRLELIRSHRCNLLPLDEALRRLRAGDLPPRSLAVTVDDGTYDFYREGFPLFRSFDVPVTIYLTTYYSTFNRPVYDTMSSYLLWKARGRRLQWPELLGKEGGVVLEGAGAELARTRLRRYPIEGQLSAEQKDALLGELAERLKLDFASIRRRRLLHIMSAAEAEELARQGADFQIHTHRHGVSFEKARFEREIVDNRRCLSALRAPHGPGISRHFCYPGGVHRPEFLPWLREWDIASAVTCEPGLVGRDTEPLLLPRLVDTSTLTEDEFVGWLSGAAAFLPRRRVLEAEGQFLEERFAGA